MKKATLFISLSLIFTTCLQAQEFEFEMDQKLVIGKENSDSTQYLFSAIRWVRPDNQGNILVAGTNNEIRKYNKDGQFRQTIGRRGRGPGEFHEVTSAEITGNNSIIVLDRLQNRVSFFNDEGELFRTEKLNLGPTSTDKLFFKENEFFVIARNYNARGKNINLVHRLDSTLTQKKEGYINVFQSFFDYADPLHVRVSKSSYSATTFGGNHIAVAPSVYTGTLIVLNSNSFKEKRLGNPVTNFVTEYDWEERHRYRESDEVGFISASGQDGQFFYKRKGSTFGLVGNENFLLHFYGLFKGDDIIPYLNVYDSEGKLLADIALREHNTPSFIKETKFSVIPHFLDDDNNLYIGDYRYEGSYPAARVFETNLDELLE